MWDDTEKRGVFESRYPANPPKHYYGDIVRKLFLVAGVLILVAIPFDAALLNFYFTIGIVGVLLLTLFAGFTSPRSKWIIIGSVVVSALGFLTFEYFAVGHYLNTHSITDIVFLIRQAIALTFILAVYFSSKTVRGFFRANF